VEAAVADHAGDHRANHPGESDEAEHETNCGAKLLPSRAHERGACDPEERPDGQDVSKRDDDAYVADRPANAAFCLGRDDPGEAVGRSGG
jgi:hypothetical protein